jgi:hypothetical protein
MLINEIPTLNMDNDVQFFFSLFSTRLLLKNHLVYSACSDSARSEMAHLEMEIRSMTLATLKVGQGQP